MDKQAALIPQTHDDKIAQIGVRDERPRVDVTSDVPPRDARKGTMNHRPATLARAQDALTAKNAARLAMHPRSSDALQVERLRVLVKDHNMAMLRRIARELVRSREDQHDLVTDLVLDLAGAAENTPAAEACSLLDSPDGAPGRGRAHRIVRNIARTRARSLITTRDREVATDFSTAQADAVAAALESDGQWHRVDKDVAASRINRNNAYSHTVQTGEPMSWSAREFTRRGERVSERTIGDDTDKGRAVRLIREQTLSTMLTDTMRVHGLHDEGRLTTDDKLVLRDWWARFAGEVPARTSFEHEAAVRADYLGTTTMRQAAALLLALTPYARPSLDRLVLADIKRGDVHTLGTLVAACTSATASRQQSRRGASERTSERMMIRTTTVLRTLGYESTSAQRRAMDKLVKRMAVEAGASAKTPMHEGRFNTLGRFPVRFG